MRTRFMLSSAMTAAEQAAGRYLRAPDGHPDAGVVTVDVPETPPAAPPAAEEAKTIEQQYDEEFGSVEADTSDEGDGDDTGEEGAEAPEPPEEPEGAPESKELDELKARNLQLEGALEEARKGKAPEAPVEEQKESPEVKAPDPADYEFGASDEKFIADNARWHAEQRFNELQEAKQVEEQIAAVETKWKDTIGSDAIKEAYPDFDELVTKGADEKKWACSPTMAILIKNSDVGAHVAHALASNAEESRRIAALDPHQQLLEFGRLEGRAQARAELAAAPPPPQKRQTNAPPPPAARSRGNGGQYATAQDALYDKMLSEF